jgi:hypothetical protein
VELTSADLEGAASQLKPAGAPRDEIRRLFIFTAPNELRSTQPCKASSD